MGSEIGLPLWIRVKLPLVNVFIKVQSDVGRNWESKHFSKWSNPTESKACATSSITIETFRCSNFAFFKQPSTRDVLIDVPS